MKIPKSISLFIILFLFFSCQSDPQPLKPKQELSGTVWTKYDGGLNDGRKVFKVLEFTEDNIVKIAYRIEKKIMYVNIGEFRYIYQNSEFWISNPDNSVAKGLIVNNQMEFGGEIFNRE